jgi:hypothetical protein
VRVCSLGNEVVVGRGSRENMELISGKSEQVSRCLSSCVDHPRPDETLA